MYYIYNNYIFIVLLILELGKNAMTPATHQKDINHYDIWYSSACFM